MGFYCLNRKFIIKNTFPILPKTIRRHQTIEHESNVLRTENMRISSPFVAFLFKIHCDASESDRTNIESDIFTALDLALSQKTKTNTFQPDIFQSKNTILSFCRFYSRSLTFSSSSRDVTMPNVRASFILSYCWL